jgi:hypothetical protein
VLCSPFQLVTHAWLGQPFPSNPFNAVQNGPN